MFRNLINWLKPKAGQAGGLQSEPPPLPPFAEPYEEDIPFAEPVEEEPPFAEPVDQPPEIQEPHLTVVDFEGTSEDIAWMSFNHDTGETIIQFLSHGQMNRWAHAYSYKDIPYHEFQLLAEGKGPFPFERYPYYQKAVSTGQRANFYIRHDHADDLYEYQRIENAR